MIRAAERPIVIAGGRLHGEGLTDLQRFAEEFNLPVATPQRRFHTFDSKHPNAGGRLPNRRIRRCSTSFRPATWCWCWARRGMLPSMTQNFTFPKAPVADQPFIHVWPDAEEVGRALLPDFGHRGRPSAVPASHAGCRPPTPVPHSAAGLG